MSRSVLSICNKFGCTPTSKWKLLREINDSIAIHLECDIKIGWRKWRKHLRISTGETQVVSIIITNIKPHNAQTKTLKLKSHQEINNSIVVLLGLEIKIHPGEREVHENFNSRKCKLCPLIRKNMSPCFELQQSDGLRNQKFITCVDSNNKLWTTNGFKFLFFFSFREINDRRLNFFQNGKRKNEINSIKSELFCEVNDPNEKNNVVKVVKQKHRFSHFNNCRFTSISMRNLERNKL